jgi:hypothetical protein
MIAIGGIHRQLKFSDFNEILHEYCSGAITGITMYSAEY